VAKRCATLQIFRRTLRVNLIGLKKLKKNPTSQVPGRAAAFANFLMRHASTLGMGMICLAVCFWMITEGTGKIFVDRGFDAFYDAQADSLLHGHWNVSPDAIMGEAFVVNGKYYGYFGFTPALPRMLLNWLFPSLYGHWTRLLMLLWIASVMAAIVAFMDQFEIRSSPFLLTVAVLGSTLLFLCSHAIVYNEAIMTGAALALWAYLFFWRYLQRPRLLLLASACLFSFLSYFGRVTVGAGPLILAALLCAALIFPSFGQWLRLPSPASAPGHAALLAICLGITGATYVSVNHAKFGTWLDPSPFRYQVQFDATRLARIEGHLNHLGNVPFNLSAYFGPGRIRFTRSFPWAGMVVTGPAAGSYAHIDLVSDYVSIPAAMPALAILSALGVIFAMKSRPPAIPVLAAAFAAGSFILVIGSITYRYLHDYYPFLVVGSILGAGAVSSLSGTRMRAAVRLLIVAAGIWSIAINLAITLRWQREIWFDPAAHADYLRLRGRVDALLH
jgi:hypothetical protein